MKINQPKSKLMKDLNINMNNKKGRKLIRQLKVKKLGIKKNKLLKK